MTTLPATRLTPLLLIILDGFGYREAIEDNAIAAAKKPCWDSLWATYPHTVISGSGRCVGLPDGQMGNSEVGHMNMGAGRIVYQDLTRIDLAIDHGDFYKNPQLLSAFQQAIKTKKRIHVLGLLSPGGVHSHERHLFALTQMAAQLGFSDLIMHCFLDGRDTPPKSALASLKHLQTLCDQGTCKIGSIIGRFYAMDRDKRYERTEAAYDLLTGSRFPFSATSAEEALQQAYARGETDEFVQATSIHAPTEAPLAIDDGDIVLFMNFRSDRARQLTSAFITSNFSDFDRKKTPSDLLFITLTQYDARFNVPVLFPQETYLQLFGEYISALQLKQLRIAETEKYAHVTFFFNGGKEDALPGEDRMLIPSPHVTTYDLQPEMSAQALTEALIAAMESQHYHAIICNFANADMVGHTGNFDATVRAIETIDSCLSEIVSAAKKTGIEILITADHGNAERMFDPATGQAHTAHTCDPVPFVYIGRPAKIVNLNGKLSDIAPTMLYLMGLSTPTAMTGEPLVQL